MTRFLVDTHVLLWWASEPQRLSDAARLAMASGHSQLFVSTASLWEITIKQSLGKLLLPGTVADLLGYAGCSVLGITFPHLDQLTSLDWHHKDPFDRMLIAQAIADELTLISSDQEFAKYSVAVLSA